MFELEGVRSGSGSFLLMGDLVCLEVRASEGYMCDLGVKDCCEQATTQASCQRRLLRANQRLHCISEMWGKARAHPIVTSCEMMLQNIFIQEFAT